MIKIELQAGDRILCRSLNTCRLAIGILLDAALWLPRFWIARSQLGNLAIMTERDCHDIGLNGCEIERYLTHRNQPQRSALMTPEVENHRAASDLAPECFRGSIQSPRFVGKGQVRRAGV